MFKYPLHYNEFFQNVSWHLVCSSPIVVILVSMMFFVKQPCSLIFDFVY